MEEHTVELLKKQVEINKAIKTSLSKSAKSLAGENKTIFVMPADPNNKVIQHYMNGVGAITVSENVIVLFLSPSFEKEMLEYVVAHEYHHSVFLEENNETGGINLLKGIIFEGRAESFASQLYPDINVPWSEPLSPEEEKIVLEELKENIDSTNTELYYEFNDGNFKKDIPMWSNYKIGYKITESYLRNHSDVSIKEWTMMDGIEVVRGSDYSELISD